MNAFRRALVAVVEGDATVQTLCGRAEKVCRREGVRVQAQLPVVTYLIVGAPQTGQNGEHRRVTVQLDCYADAASGGVGKADALSARVVDVLTHPALLAQGVDAAPMLVNERDLSGAEDEEEAAGRARVTVEIEFEWKRA